MERSSPKKPNTHRAAPSIVAENYKRGTDRDPCAVTERPRGPKVRLCATRRTDRPQPTGVRDMSVRNKLSAALLATAVTAALGSAAIAGPLTKAEAQTPPAPPTDSSSRA